MNSTIRIVAAVLDTSKLTLYGTDGATTVLPQGDTRIRRIIDEATPQLLATGSADVNMAPDVVNTFANFEEKSSKVRFFRVAKAKLKGLFGIGSKEEDSVPSDLTLGTVPQPAQPVVIVSDLELVASNTGSGNGNGHRSVDQSVIDEIMTHAVKATDPKFSEEGLDKQAPIKDLATGKTPNAHTPCDSTDTIIAVTSNGQVIPGMERIKTQFARAVKLGSPIGVERFLERIGSVITNRRHSVEDLLKFLERGDLPIAEDGCILIYKVLNHRSFRDYPQAKYADVHSSNVPQWIGARVMMAPALVDPNRRNECSNGLHVARRGYVGGFGGSVCVMAKLAPEDVIAVPDYDANKMRVCGYHIIFELSSEQFSLLKQNRPLTENAEGRTLLAKALAGQHTRVTHTVEITTQMGGGIKVTAIPEMPVVKAVTSPVLVPVQGSLNVSEAGDVELQEAPASKKKLAPADAIEDQAEAFDNPVDPRDVVKEVENLSFKGRAEALVIRILNAPEPKQQSELWAELFLIKKAAKYGWDRLGVPADLVIRMTEQTETEFPHGNNASAPSPISTPTKADPTPEPARVSEAEAESFSKRINRLALITPMTEQTATSILNLKKQSKKGWAALKVSDLIAEQVVRLTSAK